MRNLGFDGSTVNLMVAGGVNIVQFLAVFPAILYIDKWGESPAQLNPPLSPSTYEFPRGQEGSVSSV